MEKNKLDKNKFEKNKFEKNKFEKNKFEKNKIEKKIGNFVANKPSKVHLILSGSGSRFISFIGALSFFNKIFPKFKDNLGIVSCSSGGSFIGMLLCLKILMYYLFSINMDLMKVSN